MEKPASHKIKILHPIPDNPVIAICLPGDGYVGKFCGECLIATTEAKVAVLFNPYNFPTRVTVEKGSLGLHGYKFFISTKSTNPQLVVLTSDLKITEEEIAAKACRELAIFIKRLAPREIILLDACIPAQKYQGNNLSQMIIGVPGGEFWEGKTLPAFQFTNDKDKYFMFLAIALQLEQVSARAIICETSGRDIDPIGAKKVLNFLKGHPAFPTEFKFDTIDTIATAISEDLRNLSQKENERVNQEITRGKLENRNLHYIQ